MKKSIFLALVLGGGVSLSAQAMQTKDQQEEPETQILLNDEEKNDEEDNNDDTKYSTEEQFANRIGDRPVYASAYEITFRWVHNKLIANVEDTTDEDDDTKVYQVKLQPGFSVDRFMQLVEDKKEHEQLYIESTEGVVYVGIPPITFINSQVKNFNSEVNALLQEKGKDTEGLLRRAQKIIIALRGNYNRLSSELRKKDELISSLKQEAEKLRQDTIALRKSLRDLHEQGIKGAKDAEDVEKDAAQLELDINELEEDINDGEGSCKCLTTQCLKCLKSSCSKDNSMIISGACGAGVVGGIASLSYFLCGLPGLVGGAVAGSCAGSCVGSLAARRYYETCRCLNK